MILSTLLNYAMPGHTEKMRLESFDYRLPEELIAQQPLSSRESSRMMVMDRRTGSIENSTFKCLPGFLREGDCLVVNDSKVIPARLFGRKTTGGMVEILMLSGKPGAGTGHVTALLRPAKRIAPGTRIHFGEDGEAEVVGRISEKKWELRFATSLDFDEFMNRHGRTPLPPYIRRPGGKGQGEDALDRVMYQTVYARVPGSVAAPTAGLHFSRELLEGLRRRGVAIAPVTLHVGYGTFLPVETEFVEDHLMEDEFFEVSEEAAAEINRARRVIAVGTTSTRVLETAADGKGKVRASAGHTKLYIYPGYSFKRVDGLITNFHLPRSSLFILACAFAGSGLLHRAYELAIRERYRFYSYGDGMLIL